jgi:hypothetical protein
MTIDSSGNVGIGTVAPLSVLDISGQGATLRIADQRTTGIPSLEFIRGTSTTYGGDVNTDWRIRNAVGGNLVFNRADNTGTPANNGDFCTMTFDGRLGVGTMAPQYALDVSGGASGTSGARVTSTFFVTINQATTSPGFRLRPTTDAQFFQWGPNVSSGVSDASGVKLIFSGINASGSYMTIDQVTHNVGIGTTAPLSVLDISDVGATVRIADQRTTGTPSLEFIRGTSTTYGGDVNTDWRIRNTGGNLVFNRADNTGTAANNGDFGAMTFDGRLGIGTTTPSNFIHVQKGSYSTPAINTDGTTFGINFGSTNYLDQVKILAVDRTSTGDIWGGELALYTSTNGLSSTEKVRINAIGNVGIRTIAPAYALDVSAGTTAASVNMSTWPRTTASISYYGVSSATVAGAVVSWTTCNAISTQLMTVANNNGTYLNNRRTTTIVH